MVKYYRVRKRWEDAKSQLGAYTILANAKAMVDKNPGYEVYDWNGKQVYPEVAEGAAGGMSNADCPFLVKVSIDDLNIRLCPSMASLPRNLREPCSPHPM